MLFSKLGEAASSAAAVAASAVAKVAVLEDMDGMAPAAAEADNKEHGHRKHRRHRSRSRRRGSRHHDDGDLSGFDVSDDDGAPPVSGPWVNINKPMNAYDNATHTLEQMRPITHGLAPVGRQLYHEQLTNAQLALSHTRDELGRAVREKDEEVAREHAKRERAEKEARREAKNAERAREEADTLLEELRKKNAELVKALAAKALEMSEEANAHAREKATQNDVLEEATRATAKYRAQCSSLQSQLDDAKASLNASSASGEQSLSELKKKLDMEVKYKAAARMQNAALRVSLTRSLAERSSLGASWQNEEERSRLLKSQLDGAAVKAEAAVRREADLLAQIEKLELAAVHTSSERELERSRAANELSQKEESLSREVKEGQKLAEQLRDARAEALKALQHGADGERRRSIAQVNETAAKLIQEQQLTAKLAEQLKEARAEAVKQLQHGADAERKHASDELAAKQRELDQEHALSIKLAEQLKEARHEAMVAVQQQKVLADRPHSPGGMSEMSMAENESIIESLRNELEEARTRLEATLAQQSAMRRGSAVLEDDLRKARHQAEVAKAEARAEAEAEAAKRAPLTVTGVQPGVVAALEEQLAQAQAQLKLQLQAQASSTPVVVEKVVEKIVEKPVIVEKQVVVDANGRSSPLSQAFAEHTYDLKRHTVELSIFSEELGVVEAKPAAPSADAIADAEAVAKALEACSAAQHAEALAQTAATAANTKLIKAEAARDAQMLRAEEAEAKVGSAVMEASAAKREAATLKAECEAAREAVAKARTRAVDAEGQLAETEQKAEGSRLEARRNSDDLSMKLSDAERQLTELRRQLEDRDKDDEVAKGLKQQLDAALASAGEAFAKQQAAETAEKAAQASLAEKEGRYKEDLRHSQEMLNKQRDGAEELIEQLGAARAEAVRLLEERNGHEQATMAMQAERDTALSNLRALEEERSEDSKARDDAKEAEASRAKLVWEAEMERRLAEGRQDAARELKKVESAHQTTLLEFRRKAAAELANTTSQLREARGESEAVASTLRAEIATLRAQAEEDSNAATKTHNALRLELDDTRRRLDSYANRPDLQERHANAVNQLASAREGRAGLRATVDAIHAALSQLPTPLVQPGSPNDKNTTPGWMAPLVASPTGASSEVPGNDLVTSVEQLCAMHSEQRGALRVANANEAALRDEASRLRRRADELHAELASKLAQESITTAELEKERAKALAAEMMQVEIRAELEAARAAARSEAARRVEARGDELAVIEAELSTQLRSVSMEHAADTASLQAELTAARATLSAEQGRREEELAKIRTDFEAERRELARVHRKALQAAAAEEKRKLRAAAQQAADGSGGGGGNVVAQIFEALSGGGGKAAPSPSRRPASSPKNRSGSSSKQSKPHKKRTKGAGSDSSDGRWRTPTSLPLASVGPMAGLAGAYSADEEMRLEYASLPSDRYDDAYTEELLPDGGVAVAGRAPARNAAEIEQSEYLKALLRRSEDSW